MIKIICARIVRAKTGLKVISANRANPAHVTSSVEPGPGFVHVVGKWERWPGSTHAAFIWSNCASELEEEFNKNS